MTDNKASIEEIFGSDFEEESEEEQQQNQNEEVQSSSDNEVVEEVQRRVTRSSEHQKIAEKERLEEEQRKLEDQILTSQAEHYDSLLYKYDSDGDDESKPVVEIKHSERPTKDSVDLFFLRTPIQFNTDEKEFSEDNIPKNDLYTIRWKKNEESGEMESNTRVVQYEDGSYQVFVGSEVILNLEAKKYTNWSNLHLFEKVSPFCYYGHGIFTHRLNSKATSTKTMGRDIALKLSKGTTTTKIKKTVLTSKRPETEETKKVMEEAQSLKKKQQKKQQKYQNTMTMDNASLEDAGSSSDEEGNVGKIKRNTLRKPKKRSSYEDEEESADSASTGSDEDSEDSYSSDDDSSSRAHKKRR